MSFVLTRLTGVLVLIGVPMAATADELTPQEQAEREQRRIAVQKICPVTGNELGSHGEPVRAKVGKQVLYFCCEGCFEGEIDPQYWATIHKNFAKAQRICPVMKNELPAKPKWTIVDGQVFYVCCPPCTNKIEADPDAYLTQLDKLYQKSLEKEAAPGDAPARR